MKIIKRNGEEVIFDISKISTAVSKANATVPASEQLSDAQIQAIAGRVTELCAASKSQMNVEAIQDIVEH